MRSPPINLAANASYRLQLSYYFAHLANTTNADFLRISVENSQGQRQTVLEKTGTSRTDQITTSTFAVQSWAPTILDAAQLNEQAKAAMDALPARQGIGSARLENDYNFTDTATHRYRYQAVYRVVHGTI